MQGYPGWQVRDEVAPKFRWLICEKMQFYPLKWQAEWWAAADGYILTDEEPESAPWETLGTEWSYVNELRSGDLDGDDAELQLVKRSLVPRPQGPARVTAALGSFKIGKSASSAMWMAGFAIVPGLQWRLVGMEYAICEPEFGYLVEYLLSERGMNLGTKTLQNRPKDGRMWFTLDNGARFECNSWDRQDALKGKELDGYSYCLPGDAPVWMGDYSFRDIKDVKVGDEVIGYDIPDKGRAQKLRRAKVTQVHTKKDKLIRVHLKSGRSVVCTPDHRWQTATVVESIPSHTYQYYLPAKVGRSLAHVIDDPGEPYQADEKWLQGWLAGMYDGEGCRTMICQNEGHNDDVRDMIKSALEFYGFKTSAEPNGIRWRGGRQASLKFLNWFGSPRYRAKYADGAILNSRFRTPDEIVSIEELEGEHDTYCITTETGNFVAYGYASHNCEAYQFPGLECFTEFKQNLVARKGYAVFPTTPDRPWVEVLHTHGHGDPAFPDWQCVCGIERAQNPLTFSAREKVKDKETMTREKFAIHWEGKLGTYVGSVFDYQVGQRVVTTKSHPDLWIDPSKPATRENLRLPRHYSGYAGIDFGTFRNCVACAFDESGNCFVVEEFPNYRYVAGSIEDIPEAVSTWCKKVLDRMGRLMLQWSYYGDRNSQWKREFSLHGLTFSTGASPSRRMEVLKEFMQHDKLWFMPWVTTTQYEMEKALYKPATKGRGAEERVKKDDHGLDCLEHAVASRPEARHKDKARLVSPILAYITSSKKGKPKDPHMGSL